MLVSAPADAAGVLHRLAPWPVLGAVARRTVPRLVEATLVPAVLLYVLLVFVNVEVAVLAVLAWTYAAVARWRFMRRPVPGLLVLAAIGLTVRTVVALWSGSVVVYFLQPVGSTVVVAALFAGSVWYGRPMVGRLAADFCPFAPEVAVRPAVMRLFRGLTLLWAVVQLLKAVTTLVMLAALPTPTFVVSKTVTGLALTVIGITVTVAFALRTAQREGLMFAQAPPLAC